MVTRELKLVMEQQFCSEVKEEALYCDSSVYPKPTKPRLWNPSTKKVRYIGRSGAYNECSKTVYGFGYDELTDDYKVVEIIDPRFLCSINIYSVRRKCWKRLSESPKLVGKYCYLVNGALHWEAFPKHNRKRSNLPSSILSINLSTEAYQELDFPQPEHQLSHEPIDTRIGVLKDCLCVCFYSSFNRVQVWMMKEYGMKESWYKFASIPHMLVRGRQCVPPIWLFENGEILLIHGYKLMTYNPSEGNFKRCFRSADAEWRKCNNIDRYRWDNHHNLFKRPECYVQSLIDLP
ncbi:hypothetical protein FXO38_34516 [Capsicum annuum]|nr:hypothetical protein FXO38_34516 [Capsicum annuum]KAF3626671.1 hypothetical protein FXO37_30277 [Capsicum annuum]